MVSLYGIGRKAQFQPPVRFQVPYLQEGCCYKSRPPPNPTTRRWRSWYTVQVLAGERKCKERAPARPGHQVCRVKAKDPPQQLGLHSRSDEGQHGDAKGFALAWGETIQRGTRWAQCLSAMKQRSAQHSRPHRPWRKVPLEMGDGTHLGLH
jgi:hypothetical protein